MEWDGMCVFDECVGDKINLWVVDDNGDFRLLCGVMIFVGYIECLGLRLFLCFIRSCEIKCIKVKDLGFYFLVCFLVGEVIVCEFFWCFF